MVVPDIADLGEPISVVCGKDDRFDSAMPDLHSRE